MNRIFSKHSILSLVLLLALIAAIALSVVSCDKNGEVESPATELGAIPQDNASSDNGTGGNDDENSNVIGEGNTQFEFTVTFVDGTSRQYTVKTNETTVGDALSKVGLIAGEESTYGLYVKTVDGVTLDYNKDGKYWAFYINGAYASSGVDTTEIKSGEAYAFKAE